MNKFKRRKMINKLLGGKLLSIYKNFNIHASDYISNQKIYYDPNTDIGTSIFFSGSFEKKELSICRTYIKETSIVVDIGANIGVHSIYFSQIAKKGLVLAFEPALEPFALLLSNIKNIDNIIPVNLAASHDNLIADFYVTIDHAYSSLKDTKRKTVKKIKRVICCKLDDFLTGLNLDHIDFVKIDAEGFEHNILAGMQTIISRYRPIIFCEIYRGTDSNKHPDETVKFVSELGYDAFVLEGDTLVEYSKHKDIFYNYFFFPDDRSQS
jgi:FkbM family methyltransferase